MRLVDDGGRRQGLPASAPAGSSEDRAARRSDGASARNSAAKRERILHPFRRHEAGKHSAEAGKHSAFGMRLRQARHRRQHAFEPGNMPVGSFGEERLHVDAQVNGPGTGGPKKRPEAIDLSSRAISLCGANRRSGRKIGRRHASFRALHTSVMNERRRHRQSVPIIFCIDRPSKGDVRWARHSSVAARHSYPDNHSDFCCAGIDAATQDRARPLLPGAEAAPARAGALPKPLPGLGHAGDDPNSNAFCRPCGIASPLRHR